MLCLLCLLCLQYSCRQFMTDGPRSVFVEGGRRINNPPGKRSIDKKEQLAAGDVLVVKRIKKQGLAVTLTRINLSLIQANINTLHPTSHSAIPPPYIISLKILAPPFGIIRRRIQAASPLHPSTNSSSNNALRILYASTCKTASGVKWL